MKKQCLLYDALKQLDLAFNVTYREATEITLMKEHIENSQNLIKAVINYLNEEEEQAEKELEELNEILKFGAIYRFVRNYIVNTEKEGNQENILIDDLKNTQLYGNKEASNRFVMDLRKNTNDIVKNLNNDEDIERFYTNEDVEIIIQIIEKTLN